MAAAFGRPVFAIGSASLGSFGGYRGLVALRQVLELQFLARVLPAMVAVPAAHEAFDEAGELRSQRASELLGRIAAELVAAASGR
jgi:NAD(P)H-dependent FMN reductase